MQQATQPRAVEPPGLREALRALGNSFGATRTPGGNIPAGDRVRGGLTRSLDDLSLTIAGIAAPLPVRGTVRWSVHKNDAARTPLAAGPNHSVILDGATTATPSLLLKPDLVERVKGQGALPATVRILRATITLTVELSSLGLDDISETFTPEIPIPQLALPLPRMLILHRNKGFEPRSGAAIAAVGAALVVLPVNTPLSLAATNIWGEDAFNALEADLLSPLIDTVGKLSVFTGFLAAHGRLTDVLEKLSKIPLFVRIHKAEKIDNLNDERFFTLIDRSIYPADVEADNEMSALLLLGIPGVASSRVRLYENKDRNAADGRLLVSPGGFGVTVVNDLHSDNPVSDPPGKAVASPPAAGLKTFGDQISSLEFG